MPSLNRPNAPDRLPSEDFGDLFFRPHALRASMGSNSITTPSPLSTPANIPTQPRTFRSSDAENPIPYSPLASPLAVPRPFVPARRPQHAARPSHRSDSSARSRSPREIVRNSSHSPYAIKEEPIPLKMRTRSMSDEARRILGLSDVVHPRLNNADLEPRKARAGFKWKRDYLGGWIEVRVGRQNVPEGSRSMADLEEITRPLITATTTRRVSETSTILKSESRNTNEQLLPESSEHSTADSILGLPREGFYCRTKRALGLQHSPNTPYAKPQIWTPTGAILDRVTSTLRGLPSKAISVSTSAASSVSNLSIAAQPKRRSGRQHSLYSSSSSVRDRLVGRPPAGTPEPVAMYTGPDAKEYLSADMTHPDGPDFLPSEARRIHTPPLPSDKPGKRGSRGFFFDYNAPSKQFPSATPKRTLPPSKANGTFGGPSDDSWFNKKIDNLDTQESSAQEEFAASIPEHFPNSPLCPRNPKHKSGGTGTCPYHGRNKSTPSDVDMTPTPRETGTLSPVPETWWL